MIDVGTVLVAAVAALLTGFAGVWLRARYERNEAFRDRQITAADDFSTGLQHALLAVEDAWRACLRHGFMDKEERLLIRHPETGKVPAAIERALEGAQRAIDEVKARHARIELLFGPYAVSPRSGTLALIELDSALRDLEGYPQPDLDGYHRYATHARGSYRSFNEQALADIRGRPWHRRWRLALWVRRRIRLYRERRAEAHDGGVEKISNGGNP